MRNRCDWNRTGQDSIVGVVDVMRVRAVRRDNTTSRCSATVPVFFSHHEAGPKVCDGPVAVVPVPGKAEVTASSV